MPALRVLSVFALMALLVVPHAAQADALDAVRQAGVVRCGAVPKPGLAFPDAERRWRGLVMSICRAVAAAVLGAPDKVAFHAYLSPADFKQAADGGDAVAFLTASETIGAGLIGALLPGPTVFYETQGVMVAEDSPLHSLAELGDTTLCVEPGTTSERGIAAWLAAHHRPFHEFPFQEQEEMIDAFSSGVCPAIAEETTTLAKLRLDAEESGHKVRILPDAVGPDPLLAMTARDSGRLAAVVDWTVATLIQASESGGALDPSGTLRALPLAGAALDLPAGWQARALAAGGYAKLLAAALGDASIYRMPPGPNAIVGAGGLLAAPLSQ